MRVAFCCRDTEAAPWLEDLRAALPGADVQEWQPGAAAADYAIVWRPPQEFLDGQAGIKAIFNTGAGVDALLPLRFPAGAQLVRIDDGGMGVQMAEFVCHAVIRHFRELGKYEDFARMRQWALGITMERKDFPVGLMGLGALGQRVAKALKEFEFPVNGWSRTPSRLPGVQCFAGPPRFNDFLAASRILVCLLPLTTETESIMRRETLSRLRPGGYVINVARGRHLVDEDLLALIDEGHIAGATLDVFRTEPLPLSHPFWTRPEIVLTPHISARTLRSESVAQIAGKIKAMQRGEPVAGVVDRERGY